MGRAPRAGDNGSMAHPRFQHVFIVDDSAQIRARIADMLARMERVRVVGEARCAREAIERIRRTGPDCVLLDLRLVGDSGLDVLKTIHPESPRIAFIVLTNHSEPQYRDASLRAGATHFLDKSTEFERVPSLLAQLASRDRQTEESP